MKKLIYSLSSLLIFLSAAQVASAETGTWQSTTPLPIPLASHSSQAYNGSIYVMAGGNTVDIQDSLSSIANTDGTLQPWVSSSVPSPDIIQQTSVIYSNHIYLLGGATYPPTNTRNTVYMGTIGQQGTISSWTTLTPLPVNVALGAAAIVGNTVYFAGGETEVNGQGFTGQVNQNIYAATINTDGTIGNWTQVGTLPKPLFGLGLVANNNHLTIFGGQDVNFTSQDAAYTAAINTDGTIGTWQQTNSLPEPLSRSNNTIAQNTVYVAGGYDNVAQPNVNSDKVFYSTINSDGTLSAWNQSANLLPEPICCGTLSFLNGYLYLIGGFGSNSGYLNTVYYSSITPPPTTLTPTADSFLNFYEQNQNEGGSPALRIQQSLKSRALVKFDESQIAAAVGSDPNYTATLQFTITDNGNNWGTGRQIELDRLFHDWTEGNGYVNGNPTPNRGTGTGVTWNCAADSNISNNTKDCTIANTWDMDNSANYPFASPSATAIITNHEAGTVSFDVTQDVKNFLNGTNQNYGWILKKTDETVTGKVDFGSKESNNGPILIITPQ